jgi:hypothetical protein
MEEFGIVLAKTTQAKRESLLPICVQGLIFPGEAHTDPVSQQYFRSEQGSEFFYQIQQLDHFPAVGDHFRRPSAVFGPFLRFSTGPF